MVVFAGRCLNQSALQTNLPTVLDLVLQAGRVTVSAHLLVYYVVHNWHQSARAVALAQDLVWHYGNPLGIINLNELRAIIHLGIPEQVRTNANRKQVFAS